MVKKGREITQYKKSGDGAEERGEESEQPNAGKLILDATARLRGCLKSQETTRGSVVIYSVSCSQEVHCRW